MKKNFGILPSGEEASLYTISCGAIRADVTDYGATLVSLCVPDRTGAVSDVVLGLESCNDYAQAGGCLGATVGRNANRIGDATFTLNGKEYQLGVNDGKNNLHSGPDYYFKRMWKVLSHTENAITLALHSPHGDQGFPGNADVQVTYSLEPDNGLHIRYSAVCDKDTVFNLTNHSYFNLAGHDHPEAAMDQLLSMPARFFNPADDGSIPTGELRKVDGTPMDFRTPKPIGQDIEADYEPLHLQCGYDHNWEVFCNPCATLSDPVSGRCMTVITDCPGVQFYSGNHTDVQGKGGVYYGSRSGICLETQFYPDSIHQPQWPQPVTPAGEVYKSETAYLFSWQ